LYVTRDSEDDDGYLLEYPYYKTVSSSTDSLVINVSEAIQRYITGEYDYDGFTLTSDGQTYNFSHIKLNSEKKPRLEIFYSE
jgi:putative lipoic acid-binding regulatory protein